MKERRFKLEIPEKMIADRQMKKQEYKRAMSWLRLISRIVESKINWNRFDEVIRDTMLYGVTIYKPEDLLIG